jgi:pimeloyl-ACP methyl ester carboxylesterase
MAMILYSASGNPPPHERWQFLFPRERKFIESGVVPSRLPSWLTEADLDFFAGEFRRAGFRGGINWYRNFDRNWELTPFLDGAKLRQPSMFAAGELDCVLAMLGGDVSGIVRASMPGCRKMEILPGAGHWLQQERPAEINRMLIEFVRGL